jgi:nucleoside-diphosphate kinase
MGVVIKYPKRKRRIIMIQRTLAIIKPDAVSRHLIGHVLTRIELEGFEIVNMKMGHLTKEQAKELYKVHKDKPFYEAQTDFMSSGPCVMMVLEAEDVIKRYRELMGPTDYKKSKTNTIRYELATDIRHNIVHGSDSEESARFEIGFFETWADGT